MFGQSQGDTSDPSPSDKSDSNPLVPTSPLPDRPTSSPPKATALGCRQPEILSAASCLGDTLSTSETELYDKITQYRAQQRLPIIPLSATLNRLANWHLLDLTHNIDQYQLAEINRPWGSTGRSSPTAPLGEVMKEGRK